MIEIGGKPKTSRAPESGLYHIGFKIGDSPEDARAAYRELHLGGMNSENAFRLNALPTTPASPQVWRFYEKLPGHAKSRNALSFHVRK